MDKYEVILCWVPVHSLVQDNEIADELAGQDSDQSLFSHSERMDMDTRSLDQYRRMHDSKANFRTGAMTQQAKFTTMHWSDIRSMTNKWNAECVSKAKRMK